MQIKIHVFEKVVPGNVIPASTIELKRGNAETKDSEHKNRILLRILNILFQYINIMHEKRLMSFLKNTSICFKYVILHTHIMWSYYLCCGTKNPTARNLLSSGDYSIHPRTTNMGKFSDFPRKILWTFTGIVSSGLALLTLSSTKGIRSNLPIVFLGRKPGKYCARNHLWSMDAGLGYRHA